MYYHHTRKEDNECQTELQCTPFILSKNETAKVHSSRECQTEIKLSPRSPNTELYKLMPYIDEEDIERDSIQTYIIAHSRKAKLHFMLPITSSENINIPLDIENINDYKYVITDGTDEDVRFVKQSQAYMFNEDFHWSEARKSSRPEDDLESRSSNMTLRSAIKRIYKEETTTQTDLMIAPHILNDKEIATISMNTSCQTSLTCSPATSVTNIVPMLTCYWEHTGEIREGFNKTENALEILKEIIQDVINIHQHMFDPNYNLPFMDDPVLVNIEQVSAAQSSNKAIQDVSGDGHNKAVIKPSGKSIKSTEDESKPKSDSINSVSDVTSFRSSEFTLTSEDGSEYDNDITDEDLSYILDRIKQQYSLTSSKSSQSNISLSKEVKTKNTVPKDLSNLPLDSGKTDSNVAYSIDRLIADAMKITEDTTNKKFGTAKDKLPEKDPIKLCTEINSDCICSGIKIKLYFKDKNDDDELEEEQFVEMTIKPDEETFEIKKLLNISTDPVSPDIRTQIPFQEIEKCLKNQDNDIPEFLKDFLESAGEKTENTSTNLTKTDSGLQMMISTPISTVLAPETLSEDLLSSLLSKNLKENDIIKSTSSYPGYGIASFPISIEENITESKLCACVQKQKKLISSTASPFTTVFNPLYQSPNDLIPLSQGEGICECQNDKNEKIVCHHLNSLDNVCPMKYEDQTIERKSCICIEEMKNQQIAGKTSPYTTVFDEMSRKPNELIPFSAKGGICECKSDEKEEIQNEVEMEIINRVVDSVEDDNVVDTYYDHRDEARTSEDTCYEEFESIYLGRKEEFDHNQPLRNMSSYVVIPFSLSKGEMFKDQFVGAFVNTKKKHRPERIQDLNEITYEGHVYHTDSLFVQADSDDSEESVNTITSNYINAIAQKRQPNTLSYEEYMYKTVSHLQPKASEISIRHLDCICGLNIVSSSKECPHCFRRIGPQFNRKQHDSTNDEDIHSRSGHDHCITKQSIINTTKHGTVLPKNRDSQEQYTSNMSFPSNFQIFPRNPFDYNACLYAMKNYETAMINYDFANLINQSKNKSSENTRDRVHFDIDGNTVTETSAASWETQSQLLSENATVIDEQELTEITMDESDENTENIEGETLKSMIEEATDEENVTQTYSKHSSDTNREEDPHENAIDANMEFLEENAQTGIHSSDTNREEDPHENAIDANMEFIEENAQTGIDSSDINREEDPHENAIDENMELLENNAQTGIHSSDKNREEDPRENAIDANMKLIGKNVPTGNLVVKIHNEQNIDIETVTNQEIPTLKNIMDHLLNRDGKEPTDEDIAAVLDKINKAKDEGRKIKSKCKTCTSAKQQKLRLETLRRICSTCSSKSELEEIVKQNTYNKSDDVAANLTKSGIQLESKKPTENLSNWKERIKGQCKTNRCSSNRYQKKQIKSAPEMKTRCLTCNVALKSLKTLEVIHPPRSSNQSCACIKNQCRTSENTEGKSCLKKKPPQSSSSSKIDKREQISKQHSNTISSVQDRLQNISPRRSLHSEIFEFKIPKVPVNSALFNCKCQKCIFSKTSRNIHDGNKHSKCLNYTPSYLEKILKDDLPCVCSSTNLFQNEENTSVLVRENVNKNIKCNLSCVTKEKTAHPKNIHFNTKQEEFYTNPSEEFENQTTAGSFVSNKTIIDKIRYKTNKIMNIHKLDGQYSVFSIEKKMSDGDSQTTIYVLPNTMFSSLFSMIPTDFHTEYTDSEIEAIKEFTHLRNLHYQKNERLDQYDSLPTIHHSASEELVNIIAIQSLPNTSCKKACDCGSEISENREQQTEKTFSDKMDKATSMENLQEDQTNKTSKETVEIKSSIILFQNQLQQTTPFNKISSDNFSDTSKLFKEHITESETAIPLKIMGKYITWKDLIKPNFYSPATPAQNTFTSIQHSDEHLDLKTDIGIQTSSMLSTASWPELSSAPLTIEASTSTGNLDSQTSTTSSTRYHLSQNFSKVDLPFQSSNNSDVSGSKKNKHQHKYIFQTPSVAITPDYIPPALTLDASTSTPQQISTSNQIVRKESSSTSLTENPLSYEHNVSDISSLLPNVSGFENKEASTSRVKFNIDSDIDEFPENIADIEKTITNNSASTISSPKIINEEPSTFSLPHVQFEEISNLILPEVNLIYTATEVNIPTDDLDFNQNEEQRERLQPSNKFIYKKESIEQSTKIEEYINSEEEVILSETDNSTNPEVLQNIEHSASLQQLNIPSDDDMIDFGANEVVDTELYPSDLTTTDLNSLSFSFSNEEDSNKLLNKNQSSGYKKINKLTNSPLDASTSKILQNTYDSELESENLLSRAIDAYTEYLSLKKGISSNFNMSKIDVPYQQLSKNLEVEEVEPIQQTSNSFQLSNVPSNNRLKRNSRISSLMSVTKRNSVNSYLNKSIENVRNFSDSKIHSPSMKVSSSQADHFYSNYLKQKEELEINIAKMLTKNEQAVQLLKELSQEEISVKEEQNADYSNQSNLSSVKSHSSTEEFLNKTESDYSKYVERIVQHDNDHVKTLLEKKGIADELKKQDLNSLNSYSSTEAFLHKIEGSYSRHVKRKAAFEKQHSVSPLPSILKKERSHESRNLRSSINSELRSDKFVFHDSDDDSRSSDDKVPNYQSKHSRGPANSHLKFSEDSNTRRYRTESNMLPPIRENDEVNNFSSLINEAGEERVLNLTYSPFEYLPTAPVDIYNDLKSDKFHFTTKDDYSTYLEEQEEIEERASGYIFKKNILRNPKSRVLRADGYSMPSRHSRHSTPKDTIFKQEASHNMNSANKKNSATSKIRSFVRSGTTDALINQTGDLSRELSIEEMDNILPELAESSHKILETVHSCEQRLQPIKHALKNIKMKLKQLNIPEENSDYPSSHNINENNKAYVYLPPPPSALGENRCSYKTKMTFQLKKPIKPLKVTANVNPFAIKHKYILNTDDNGHRNSNFSSFSDPPYFTPKTPSNTKKPKFSGKKYVEQPNSTRKPTLNEDPYLWDDGYKDMDEIEQYDYLPNSYQMYNYQPRTDSLNNCVIFSPNENTSQVTIPTDLSLDLSDDAYSFNRENSQKSTKSDYPVTKNKSQK